MEKIQFNNKHRATLGFALREVLLGLGVISLVTIALVSQLTDAFKSSRQANAEDQLRSLVSSVVAYGSRNSNYDGISITQLKTRNYTLSGISTGISDNIYRLDSEVIATDSNLNAQISYDSPDQGTCQALTEILTDTQTLIINTITCTDGELVFKVD